MAGETGLEPVTSCLTGKRSTLLSYSPLFFCLSNTSNTSSGETIPASTSLWQFEQSNTHLSNSAFTVSQLLVSPDPIPNSLLDGSTWWNSNADSHLSYPHIPHFPPLYSMALCFITFLRFLTALESCYFRLWCLSVTSNSIFLVLCLPNGEHSKQ